MGYMTTKDKRDFWYMVRRCMQTFHQIEPVSAKRMIKEYRRKLGENKSIYHEQPYDLAWELCRKDELVEVPEAHHKKYWVEMLGHTLDKHES